MLLVMDLEDMNTADQAAEYLKLTADKLKAMARRGEIGHVRAGRSYLFPRAAVEEWITRNTRDVVTPPERPFGLTERSYRRLCDRSGRLDRL